MLKGGSLVKKSSYNKEFIEQPESKSELQKEKDHLRQTGPSQKLTSYAHQFVAHPGVNQYVLYFLWRLNQQIDIVSITLLWIQRLPMEDSSKLNNLAVWKL